MHLLLWVGGCVHGWCSSGGISLRSGASRRIKRPDGEGGGARPEAARGAQQSEHRTGEDVGKAFTPEPSMTGLCVEQRRAGLQSATRSRTRPPASHDNKCTVNARSQGCDPSPRSGALQGRVRTPTGSQVRARPAHGSAQARGMFRAAQQSPQGMSAQARTRCSPVGSERHDAPRGLQDCRFNPGRCCWMDDRYRLLS